MSVQITKHPKPISFSRNAVEFQFYTDAQLKTKGKPFVGKLAFVYEATSPYSFTITYGDLTLNFDVALIPDNSGYQLPTRQIDNAEAYARLLAQSFGENFYLGRDFTFTVGTDGVNYWVVATARNNGTGYNMGISGSAYMGFQTLQAGVNDVANPNFKLYTEIWAQVGGSSAPTQLSNAYQEVNPDGYVNMDISGALTDAMLAAGYDRPDFINAIAGVNTTSTCQYYLRYAEVYGDTQVIKRVIQTDVYNAVLGGISKEMLTTTQLPDSFIANGKCLFLKQDNAEKYLLPEQDEFLSIIMLDGDHSGVSLKFTITYSDNTTLTLLKFALGDVRQYAKLTFPVGFVQNNLNLLDSTRAVLNYSVVLVDAAGTEISETRKYWIDYTLRLYTRQFIYLSSLGTYDTLITFGQGSTQYNLVQSSAEIANDKGFILANGEQINYSNSLNNIETVTSGYRQPAEIRLFKDLALSLDLLLYRKKRIYAVSLSSNNIKEFKDAENLHAITFDFGFRYSEELFTTDPADDNDMPMFLPLDLAQMPDAGGPDNSLDYRYYLKTETYNQTEVNNLLSKLKDIIDAATKREADDYAALLLALANKSNLDHTHPDYITREEFNDLLEALDNTKIATYLYVKSTDPNISYDEQGRFVYKHASLLNQTGYLIQPLQVGTLSPVDGVDVSYNAEAGAFTVLVPGFQLLADSTMVVWTSDYINVPDSNHPQPGTDNLNIVPLTVIAEGQTQFNISTFPTKQSWLNINGIEYYLTEHYTIGLINGNVTLTWLNIFPLSPSDTIKLFKD